LAEQAHGVIAAAAEFALAAKQVGLHGDMIAWLPDGNGAANFEDAACGFATGSTRKLYGNRQSAFFQPKIEMIESAGMNLDDDFVGGRMRVWEVPQFKLPRRAVGRELEGFHRGLFKRAEGEVTSGFVARVRLNNLHVRRESRGREHTTRLVFQRRGVTSQAYPSIPARAAEK
jgi:hypothetical protein